MATALTFELGGRSGAPGPHSMVQVDRVMSEVNHRLYRQHMTYTCRVDLNTDQVFNMVEVYALAPTWYVMNSLREAKRVHDKAMKEERAATGQARWYDFRINPGFGGTVEAMTAYGRDRSAGLPGPVMVSMTGGEYNYSNIEDEVGANRDFLLQGVTSGSSFSVFEEYDAMGNVDASPSTPAPGGYDGVDATIESENQANLLSRGNLPPYAADTWNLVWVKVGELYQTSGGLSSKSTGYFDAPLGLILIPNHAATSTNISLKVKPGQYKGCQAVPI